MKGRLKVEGMEAWQLIEEWVALAWVVEDADRPSRSRSSRQPESYREIQSKSLAPRKRQLRQEMEKRELLRPRP